MLSVSAIKNGTVIDHIPQGGALKILQLVNLVKDQVQVTLGLNLQSGKMQRKDIIKIEDRKLTPSELHQVAILAPCATVNIIQNYKVKEKVPLTMPDTIEHIFRCPNKKCITQEEKSLSFFFVEQEEKEVFLRCKYCEKRFK